LLLERFPRLTAVEAKSALMAFSESAALAGESRQPARTVN
jgi:hypothetical protein